MGESGTTVYGFRVYGVHAERQHVAGCKATLEAIERLGGEPLRGTGERVDDADIDDDGCYRRVPTGWGALS